MIRGKKILSLLLVMVMCFGLTLAAKADEISETKKKQEELEEQKNTAEAEKEELNATLNEVIKDMEKTQADMEAAYGTDYEEVNGAFVYTKGNGQLSFIIENDEIVVIEYKTKVDYD